MDVSDYHIATKKIHELREQLRATEDLCQSLVKRIQEGMHWLPMTEDAVFEDGRAYLVQMFDTALELVVWNEDKYVFGNHKTAFMPKYITHYARITEPGGKAGV